ELVTQLEIERQARIGGGLVKHAETCLAKEKVLSLPGAGPAHNDRVHRTARRWTALRRRPCPPVMHP
ncbi:hypothetical protein, partial [Salmonella enterica]|uniref:hypothetical protein n=1 Tax=Salmonella enterica TaxID=28901 RepID=UPI003CF47738